MNRLFSVLLLSLMLFQAYLFPVNVKAQPEQIDCPVTVTIVTLPATDITASTAVFNGSFSGTIRYLGATAQQEDTPPIFFEYGTTPGIYPYRVNADIVSQQADTIEGGFTITFTLRGSAVGLTPCQTYYVHLIYTDTIPYDEMCIIRADATSFQTTGCVSYIGTGPTSHGTGGFNGTTITQPTNLSNIVVQSATITSTKVSPGEKVDVTAYVINKGNSNGTIRVTLYINGQVVDSKGITLTSGESTQVHFSVGQNDPGTYSVYVNGVPAGNLTVDLFTNNDALIYGVIGLFTIGIIGVLYLFVRRRTT